MSINQKKRLQNLISESRATLLDMLKQRGCDTKQFMNFSYDTLTVLLDKHEQGKYQNNVELSPLDVELKNTKTDSRIIVKYRLDEKFKNTAALKKLVNNIYSHHNLEEKDTLILLVINSILPKPSDRDNPVYSFTEEFRLQHKYVQVFGLENLLINISKHIFVPKHTIMSDDEIKEICNHYNIQPRNLHKILQQDPMAKFIGLRPGQVVKTFTNNPITGISETYKLCIE
jgi:DNA-directed RNA polymerase I, II, and III subunit RPABC1